MTHISAMTMQARRPYLVLLAVWRATGKSLSAVATPSNIDHQLQVLGEDHVTDADLIGLFEKGWIFDVDFEMTAQMRATGIPVAQEVSDEVEDLILRSRCLRVSILRWIWEQTDGAGREEVRLDRFLDQGLTYFGSLYNQPEVERAAAHLENKGLIEGPGLGRVRGPIKARLTNAGLAQAEGDVEGTPSVSQIVNHTYNHSNVAQSSTNVAQSMDNRTSNAEGVEAILQLVRQWQRSLTADVYAEGLEEAIADVETTVRGGAQPGPTKQALERLKNVLQDSASGAVGQAGGAGIIYAISGLLQSVGWA
ncbi:hypothetical protein [Arthrobacter sp. TMN-50]